MQKLLNEYALGTKIISPGKNLLEQVEEKKSASSEEKDVTVDEKFEAMTNYTRMRQEKKNVDMM
jgi:hypothetical protein